MTLLLPILIPVIGGLIALFIRNIRTALGVLILISAAHLFITTAYWTIPPPAGEWLALDLPGHLFLTLTSVLFFIVSLYFVPYLLHAKQDGESIPRLFVPCLLGLLATLTLVMVSQHLALIWAGIEVALLVSAPLIYFYRKKSALEATWNRFLLCSVGIALALLAIFFLGAATDSETPLTLTALQKAKMAPLWLKAAFIMALIGYGTQMGLAPLHTWLPGVHSSAPAPVSALFSGTLLNTAFLGLLRFYQVVLAAGEEAFAQQLFLIFGFISMGVAAVRQTPSVRQTASVSMVHEDDYKRLLAYSSVGNMGVLAVGIGLGGNALMGMLLHVINHSFCQAGLFLLSGNLFRVYRTKTASPVRGALTRLPISGTLLAATLFAIGGMPPFGLFISKWIIFQSAMSSDQVGLGVLFISLMVIAFLGMARVFLPMLQGAPTEEAFDDPEPVLSIMPPLTLVLLVLVMGVYIPPPISEILTLTAQTLGGGGLPRGGP
jgi:hydrogenase-4 component F